MQCKTCGQEINDNWVRFKNLKIEVNFQQEQDNTLFKDIKIPDGCRLLKYNELPVIIDYIIKTNLTIWSYFEQPIESFKGKYVARFSADSLGVSLGCNRDPWFSDYSLGVIFCRDVKN